ncbi:restriction endonuclease subunit S [Bacillus mycoides]|nr:hypothetical protein II1_04807 [Bacillus cereus MC118]
MSELVEKGYKKTIFGNVPKHWKVKTFNDLLDENIIEGIQDGNHGGLHPKAVDYVSTGIPFVMANNLKKGTIDLSSCNFISKQQADSLRIGFSYEGDVLLSHKGTVGRIAIVPEVEEYIMLTPQVTYYRVGDKKKLSNFFLKFFFESNSFQLMLSRLSAQSTRDYIGITSQKKLPIVLPSIEEQKKIVSILSSVEETIQRTEAIIEQTEQLKKGLTQQLLTKGIGHTKFKKTEIGEIPLGWEVKELVELANSNDRYAFTGGPFGSNLKSSDYTEDGVRIIQLQNIKDGYFANDYKIYTSESKANELFSCNIYPGDIIMAKMAEPVARACIIPNYSDRYLMASDGIRLSVDKTKYITEYVTYAINAPYFRQQAVNNSTGTTRLRIGLSTLRRLKILVPSIEEQEKIADILINVDRKIEKEQSKVLKLKELKEGLMQFLLTGKVRVKVDEAEVTQV